MSNAHEQFIPSPTLCRRLCEARRRTEDEVLMDEVERIKSVVARNAVTATREPDLYDGQDMPSQESAFLTFVWEMQNGCR